MAPLASPQAALTDLVRALARWAHGWWRVAELGALLLALALTPSTYTPVYRAVLLRQLVLGTAPSLPGFTVLSTLLSLIVIRIVIVTSISYGLSQYALEMVVRVLVLELIPLTAALFAALRCTIPLAGEVAVLRAQGRWNAQQADGVDPMRTEVLPRLCAGLFCALLMAAVSCGVTLVLAYLSVYGLTFAGFAGYTRTVGHVFGPAVSLVFGLKIGAMALAVALLPLASVLVGPVHRRVATSAELQGLVRMFFVILVIEAASLVGNYY